MDIVIQPFPDAYNFGLGMKHLIIYLKGDRENPAGIKHQNEEARDLPAKKEAQEEAFLESEIKSGRNVPEGQNRMETPSSQLSSDISDTSFVTSSSPVERSTSSSDISSEDFSSSTSVMGDTESSSSMRSSGLTQASQRRATAQPKDSAETPDGEPAPPENLSLPTAVSGRHQDPFSPLLIDSGEMDQSFRCMENHGRTCSTDYKSSASSSFSAIGNVRIAEVDPGGHFVRILNCAPDKEERIGNYLLKQDVRGQPVAEFCFPPETRVGAGSTVTVWAADAKVLHRPPSDFLWKGLKRFRTSLDCATILCEPNGQAVAWYAPLCWNGRQGWMAKEESENIVTPAFSTTKQNEEGEEEQKFTITDTESKCADTGQKPKSFIKREKKTFPLLFPQQSAWCQSPNAPTHPHFSLDRALTLGNDGSSLCRQSRCQSSRPDPVPGTLYAGTRRKKEPSVPSRLGWGGRRPTWSAGPNFGGVMYIGSLPLEGTALQKYFVFPSYSSML